METETEAELQGLEQDHTYEVEHGPGVGPFFDDEASHVSEFRTKREAFGGPCDELSWRNIANGQA